jgi:RNA polymerase sigma-70 factor (ECF subfamily)
MTARTNESGELLLLADQDRTKWDTRQIREGLAHFERSIGGDIITTYHVEAAIASAHLHENPDWSYITGLYDQLYILKPTPVVALNRAVAISKWISPQAGIAELYQLENNQALEGYYLLPATLASLWNECGSTEKAQHYFRKALACVMSEPERRFLQSKCDGN